MIDLIVIDGSMTFTLEREVTYSRFKGSWVPLISPFPQGGICGLTASGLRAGLPSLCGLGGASSTLTLGRTGRRQTQAVWSVGWMERQIKWLGVGVTNPFTVYINPYQNARVLYMTHLWSKIIQAGERWTRTNTQELSLNNNLEVILNALGGCHSHSRNTRMMEQMNMDVNAVDGSCYVCNVSVLRCKMGWDDPHKA